MAPRRLSLPIILAALLLFSHVFARELEEKPAADKKDPDLNVDDAKYYVPDGYYKHYPYYHRPCKYHCGYKGCCSEEEFAVFSQTQMNEFNDDKHGGYGGYGHGPGYGYGHRPGYGYGRGGYGYRRPPPCYYRCGYRCCSAEEYAEYVQAGN